MSGSDPSELPRFLFIDPEQRSVSYEALRALLGYHDPGARTALARLAKLQARNAIAAGSTDEMHKALLAYDDYELEDMMHAAGGTDLESLARSHYEGRGQGCGADPAFDAELASLLDGEAQ